MANKTIASPVVQTPSSSFKDIGYRSAKSIEQGIELGFLVLEQCPTFLDEVPKEVKEQLESGYMLRFSELPSNPVKYYDSKWIDTTRGKEAYKVDIFYAMGIGSQEFGKFKTEEPMKYNAIKAIRDKFSNYKSQCSARLMAYVKDAKAVKDGKPKVRNANKDFVQVLFDFGDTLSGKKKTCEGRSDSTVITSISLYNDLVEVFKKHSNLKPKK
jgi:hypothetical protein